MEKYLILIPTYNERKNISVLIPDLRTKFPGLDILIIDDNSPDGTYKLVEEFSKKDGKIHLLLKERKEGLGKALFAGYKYAVENGYQKVIQMDADFSHPLEYIPRILKNLDFKTIVVCSRHIEGGGFLNWPFQRVFLSWSANFIVRVLLFLKVKDATSGYRGFPAAFLKEFIRKMPVSSGYLIQVETVLKAQKSGYGVEEIPFVYLKRKEGKSKLGVYEALKSGWALLILCFERY